MRAALQHTRIRPVLGSGVRPGLPSWPSSHSKPRPALLRELAVPNPSWTNESCDLNNDTGSSCSASHTPQQSQSSFRKRDTSPSSRPRYAEQTERKRSHGPSPRQAALSPPSRAPYRISWARGRPAMYFSRKPATFVPDSPFAPILALPPTTRAAEALNLLPVGPVHPYILSVILSMRTDLGALSRILALLISSTPVAADFPSDRRTRSHLDAVTVFLSSCVYLRGYIFLEPAVDSALQAMAVLDDHDRAKAKKEGEAATKILARYHRLMTAMIEPEVGWQESSQSQERRVSWGKQRTEALEDEHHSSHGSGEFRHARGDDATPSHVFGLQGTGVSLSQPVRDQVTRIVDRLLCELSGMGSSIAARPSTVSALFGPFLTSETLSPLMRHVANHAVPLREWQWRRAAGVAIESGHRTLGLEYLANAAKAHDAERTGHRLSVESKVEHASNMPDVLPAHRLTAALCALTLDDSITALSPLLIADRQTMEAAKGTRKEPAVDEPPIFSASPRSNTSTLDSTASSAAFPLATSLASASASTSTSALASALEPASTFPASIPASSTTSASSAPSSPPTSTSKPLPSTASRDPHTPHPFQALSRAWSILITRAGEDPNVSTDDLLVLASSLPKIGMRAATVTPLIRALMERREYAQATHIWDSVRERFARTFPKERVRLIDAALLSTAAQLRSLSPPDREDPVHAAVKAVDKLAAQRRVIGGKLRLNAYKTMLRCVPFDTRGLNVLLRICARESRPSVALRLWHAAEERWGVLPDDMSLKFVLEAARHAALVPDTMEARVQMMKDTFSFSFGAKQSKTYPQSGLPQQTRVLLDPPGYTWRAEYGTRTPPDVARALFERILLSNWPGLAHIPSPLARGGLNDLKSLLVPLRLAPAPPKPLPAASSNPYDPVYAHLVLGSEVWSAYLKLLTRHFPDEDIALRLAYMRALGVIPERSSMLEVLNAVGEREGARVRVKTPMGTRLMRDEEILRAYLEDWLGSGHAHVEDDPRRTKTDEQTEIRPVPSEEEVAHFRRRIEKHKAKLLRRMQRHLEEVGHE